MATEQPNDLQRPFHPTDLPHGMRNYDLGALSAEQKENLNALKIEQRRQNELYLHKHPEIQGLISILLRHVLTKTPSKNVHQVVGNFFSRPHFIIIEELLECLEETNCTSEIVDDMRKLITIEKYQEMPSEEIETCFSNGNQF